MLKKMICATGAAALLFLASGPASATLLQNWKLDVDGATTGFAPTTISSYLSTQGSSYISNTLTGPSSFTFKDFGFFQVSGNDGHGFTKQGGISPLTNNEISAIFNGTGTGVLGGAINFNAGGTVSMYAGAGATTNFGEITSTSNPGVFYGANDGINIANFTITSGKGAVDAQGVPVDNGIITLNMVSTYLAPGYFFNSANIDLSALPPSEIILGFATTNASMTANPIPIELRTEMEAYSGFSGTASNPPGQLYVSNGGQFKLAEVPEPSTMLLFGAGLMGVAIFKKRKNAA